MLKKFYPEKDRSLNWWVPPRVPPRDPPAFWNIDLFVVSIAYELKLDNHQVASKQQQLPLVVVIARMSTGVLPVFDSITAV